MKIYTTAPFSVLAEYNRIMKKYEEDEYVIQSGNIGDVESSVMLDTAWTEANPNAPTSGSDVPPDPPEYVFDMAYLIAEMDWNLNEKIVGILEDEKNDGNITPQKFAAQRRMIGRDVEAFRMLCAKSGALNMPTFVAEIFREGGHG